MPVCPEKSIMMHCGKLYVLFKLRFLDEAPFLLVLLIGFIILYMFDARIFHYNALLDEMSLYITCISLGAVDGNTRPGQSHSFTLLVRNIV